MRLALLASALLLLSLCCTPAEPPLRVGVLVWPPYELFVLAEDLGHYGDRIELVDVRSPAEAVRAYRNGSIDVMLLTLEYALQAFARDPEQRIVHIIDISNGGDALVARPPFERVADLRGRRIGVETGALGAYMLERALAHGGLDPADVIIVPVDIADQVDAFAAGAVDAVITYEPSRTRTIALGGRELFSSRDIPGEILDVMVVARTVAGRRADDIALLIDGWYRAQDYLRDAPDDALARMAPRTGLTTDDLRIAFGGVILPDRSRNARLLSGTDSATLDAWRRHARRMYDLDILQAPVDPAAMLWSRFADVPQ